MSGLPVSLDYYNKAPSPFQRHYGTYLRLLHLTLAETAVGAELTPVAPP
jgi:hypothetical protein